MATLKKVAFTIEIDETAIAPRSVEVFLYQMLNRLGYEHHIQSITVDDVTTAIKSTSDMYNLPLGENLPLSAKVILK